MISCSDMQVISLLIALTESSETIYKPYFHILSYQVLEEDGIVSV